MVLKDRMKTTRKEEERICEGQARFGPNRTCVDLIYQVNIKNILQSRKDTGLPTYQVPGIVYFQIYKRLLIKYGGMGCEKRCGRLGSEERCGV